MRRFIYECKWGINFFKDPVYSLYIYNAYISTAQHKKVASESSVDYFKYTGFSIYPAYVAMEKSPLKVALIQEAEGKAVDKTPQYLKYRNFLMGLSEEKRALRQRLWNGGKKRGQRERKMFYNARCVNKGI